MEKDISTFFSCFEKANTTDFRSRTAAEIYATMQHEYSNEDAIDVLSYQLEKDDLLVNKNWCRDWQRDLLWVKCEAITSGA